ncbi:serine/threonine-protein kinase [Streptomyces sp. MspMP-M5]|uniref:serine/threonine-protein kinase n=1 Tax=unclassified Streptomyces TaxID=2593676 RepID=UPI00037F9083|nr:serine/threonine-protein kinase [Streptomyces sp. MspMP-M5]MYT29590.1 protein kinase [Streptomyces sp. SID8354]
MSDEGRLVAGRYRLTEQIGRGGMGTVWRVQDEVLGRQVALKRLHVQPQLSDDQLATLYERMRREARSAARIVHPNVVVVHDVVDDAGQPCIVMEYVPAVTLGERIRQHGTIAPEEAARIGLGMVAALRAAHRAGVLHRDVKPGNVMLGAEGRVVLTDFGIAMTADASTLTKTGEMVGSIHYMAPERIRGRKPGPASDLWALGATLYQAVEGRPPFHRPTAMEAAYAIAVDPLEPMKLAGPLEPLITALLSKEPDERPSAEETERALRAVRSSGATAPGGPTAPLAPTAPIASAAPMGSTAPTGTSGPTMALSPDSASPGSAATATSRSLSQPPTGEATAPTEPVRADPAQAEGSGDRRRRGRRRGLVTTVVALTVVAASVAGAMYATSGRDGSSTSQTPGTDARQRPGAATPSYAYTPPPMPQGFHQVSEIGADFRVPDGWKVIKRTGETVIYGDESGRVGLTVGMVQPAGSNPMPHFADMEANTKLNYSVYRRLRMQQTAFRDQPAVVWEFTFKGRARSYRGIKLGFGREGGREYDIYLSAPESQWDTYRPLFDKVTDGFTTSGR